MSYTSTAAGPRPDTRRLPKRRVTDSGDESATRGRAPDRSDHIKLLYRRRHSRERPGGGEGTGRDRGTGHARGTGHDRCTSHHRGTGTGHDRGTGHSSSRVGVDECSSAQDHTGPIDQHGRLDGGVINSRAT